MNQQESKKKFNQNSIPPPGDENQEKKKPRFNIYWVWGLVAIGLVAYNLVRGVSSNGLETDMEKFKAAMYSA
jgi:AFG3 family protein